MTEMNENPIPFEEAFTNLQKIVDQLEKETVDLEKAISLYQEGRAYASICSRYLDQAELRIRSIDEQTTDDSEIDGQDSEK